MLRQDSCTGWSGKKNGELLGLMASPGFHLLVTIDKNLRHQQNLSQHGISVVLLDALDNKLSTLIPFIEKLELRLSLPLKEDILEINPLTVPSRIFKKYLRLLLNESHFLRDKNIL